MRPTTLRRAVAALAAGGIAAALLGGCASPPAAPLPTVASVDIDRYLGTWYEIASLPNRFQSACVADTRARYARDGENLSVDNRCREADGKVRGAIGVAKVVPDSGNAKLRVSFFRPFYGHYWILALDLERGWVLVGEPDRRYGWVLARRPDLPEAERERALARARELGYDTAAFRLTLQRQAID